MINDKLKKLISHQKLGFIATISPDGMPNLSPRGTFTVLDDTTLFFANICSPQTMVNLSHNPYAEINFVDPLTRKGFRLKGKCTILQSGKKYDELISILRTNGIKSEIQEIVTITILSSTELISPLYDLGLSENEIKQKWKSNFLSM